MKSIAFLLLCAFAITLSAKCQSPEFSKGETDRDVVVSFEDSFKGFPIKLRSSDGLIWEGKAKASLAASSLTILVSTECTPSGECFKVRGFISNGEKSALDTNVDFENKTITLKKGTKFEVVKGDDERWTHLGPSDKMPDCNTNQMSH